VRMSLIEREDELLLVESWCKPDLGDRKGGDAFAES
jgi:hypothetical protein